jgi:NhaA family Na+:H+ antiporter
MKKRVPHALMVFLIALAIFDDIGGILVIAFFYGEGLRGWWLLAAGGITGALYLCNRLHARSALLYAAAGVALWYALHAGGVHATIAGVVLGLMVPARPRRSSREVLVELGDHVQRLVSAPAPAELDDAAVLQIEEKLEELQAPLSRFVHALHPTVAFAIVPLFALANAGVALGSVQTLSGPVALGVGLGLLLGKPIGILAATWLAVRLRLSPAPGGASWPRIAGVAVVGGIGFTVALFIAGLAYPAQADLLDQAKAGILLGSAAAGIAGVLWLRLCPPTPGA